ncbi:excalibur calcium-binding domain-containing protein [[Roseibacterium] beibuensis]|uniref:excalibur calcium-binding domain-containing protein n=1 Tax=[Roseibacterium] beibuensis TaxID=1193142 RepID=UPI0038637AC5
MPKNGIPKTGGTLAIFALLALSGPAISADEPSLHPQPESPRLQLPELAQSYSCSPRRYCSRNISSCREARWYFQNCWWGGALDGDNDGIPCENLC